MKKTQPSNYKLFPFAPKWVILAYGFMGLCMIPWTIYLGYSLPRRNLAPHWDIAWVGLDIFIITALLGNALFAVLKSKFLVISLIVTSTLLFLDAWFDVASARAGRPLIVAISEALIFELPLALISFSVAWNLITNLDFKSRL
jgi:hypothetical protein